MPGRNVNWIAALICGIVIGWTLYILLHNFAFFILDWTIGLSDVLAIVIEIILACVIAQLIDNKLNNTRVEKDYFINELDSVNDIYANLEKVCSRETTLSLQNVTYDIGKSRKILQRMWKMMKEVNNDFHKLNQDAFSAMLATINGINSKLTDTSTFKEEDGFTPIKISRDHIYLNNSVKPEIDRDMGYLKDQIFELKIKINRI